MSDFLASVDGVIAPAAESTISVTDEGLLRGDGVFEVARLYNGVPFAMDDHFSRLGRSADGLKLEFDLIALQREVTALLEETGPVEALLRIVCTRGGRRIALIEPLPATPETAKVATITFAPGRILDGLKTLSYGGNMLATRLAKEQGADEALFVSPHGRVLEGPTWSFFWVDSDGSLLTPPLEDRILRSITRDILLEITDAEERITTLDDLAGAQEAFIASSLREGLPISAIDGRELPAAPGPVTTAAQQALRGHIAASLLKVLTVIGNRPQFVKAAAVSARLRAQATEVMVHTGQHYDDELSRVFFDELGLPRPEHRLDLGGGSNTEQTARMLAAVAELLSTEAPDVVLVYGDTNSTLAGALAAAQARVPVAHVEAGMRSFDRAMPEELNRVLTDHASDLLLCPSEAAAQNLRAERVAGRVEVVGDVMVDVAQMVGPRADTGILSELGVTPGAYVLVTTHRAGNVDDPARLRMLVDLLLAIPLAIVLPLHPRTRARLEAGGMLGELAGLHVTAPLGYLDFTTLLRQSAAVLTDSGGVQKEAYLAGVRCVTMRDTTEWTETIDAGWNTLVDLDREQALAALAAPQPTERPPLYGDGHAGERVVASLIGLGA